MFDLLAGQLYQSRQPTNQIYAAQQIATQSAHVTLTVVDNTNPSLPFLIAPPNNNYITVGTPTFIWDESTDDRGIQKYQLYLNGSLVYDNLSTGSQETSHYLYTHNTTDRQYQLKLKNLLADGSYTWKIRVYDINGNFSESATWTFIIDTQAPAFVLTNIGEVATSISAQDVSTVPDHPIELENNEPLLSGTGEANSSVVLTVTAPDDAPLTYTVTIDASSHWEIQLGVFTRGDVIALDFVITDQAGLVSVLEGVQFAVQGIIVVIPPSPKPSPRPSALASPTPGISPEPSAVVAPTPESSPIPPLLIIPITPPREMIIEAFQELFENLPEPIKVLISLVPTGVKEATKALAPISAALVATALPVASAIAIGSQVGGNLSLQLLLRLLQSLGLLPSGKPQGLVYDSKTHEPVAFARLTIYSEEAEIQITETVITDTNGVYKGLKLTPGLYRIVVSHQDYSFPALHKRPPYLQFKDYYLGEVFKVTSELQQQLFLIPVDPKEVTVARPLKTRMRLLLARIGRLTSRLTSRLTIPLFLITGFLLLLFPTIWNLIIFGFYCLLILYRFIALLRRPIITGLVVDKDKQPLENAIIRVVDPSNNQAISVSTTSQTGQFKVYADRGLYHLEIIMAGYVWEEVATAMSFYQVDASKRPQDLIIVMERVEDLYQELFT